MAINVCFWKHGMLCISPYLNDDTTKEADPGSHEHHDVVVGYSCIYVTRTLKSI